MKKFLEKFRKIAGFPFVFLLIMILFLGVTLGTAGATSRTKSSVSNLGESFELQYHSDTNFSWVIFEVSAPKTEDEDGKEKEMDVRLYDVYINLGTIYSEAEVVTLDLYWGYSYTKAENFYALSNMNAAKIYNPAYKAPEGEEESSEGKSEDYIYNPAYRWLAPFGVRNLSDSYTSVSSPVYFKLWLPKVNSKPQSGNIVINEIVFIGEVQKDGKGTGEKVVLPVKLDSRSWVPPKEGESRSEAIERAAALIDAQSLVEAEAIASSTVSSYYTYTAEEEKMVLTINEMKRGSFYVPGDVYDGDKTYNSLALTLTYFGTMIFGMSPFGLRFFNVLASFGVLVVGFFFARRLFKSDNAGLLFAVIYALCGVSISLAHLATPIMLGVFFLLSSYAACYRYWAVGMKKSSALYTLPLLVSALSGALAVLVNGAFVIPLIGVVALFIAGVLKQRRKDRAALNAAIDAYEEEQATKNEKKQDEEEGESERAEELKNCLAAYRYNAVSASVIFSSVLIVGLFILSVLFALPVSYAVDKIYNGVVGNSSNFFRIAYILFTAGFARGATEQSGWNYFYHIFTGTGERYAVTLGVVNFAATLLGALGIIYAVYRIVRLVLAGAKAEHYAPAVVPLIGMILCLITASFAGGSVAFVTLSNLFAFLLIAGGSVSLPKELGASENHSALVAKRTVTGVLIALYSLLVICFALLAVFIFSIPLPASFMAKFF